MFRTLARLTLCLIVTAWLAPHMAYAQRAPHVETPHVVHAPVPHVAHADGGEHASAKSGTDPKGPSLTVAQRIDANPQLVAKLTPLVPSGMTLDQAAQGFRNQGQFIAALHVSHNLNIPFDKLKADMVGTNHDSLGGAIRDLAPTASAKVEAQKAETEAKADINATRPAEPDTDDVGKSVADVK